MKVAKKIGRRCVLIHTTDQSAILLADYADALSEYFIFPELSPKLVRMLTSKKEMQFLAKKHGISTAKTWFPQSYEDIVNCAKEAVFPVMLKEITRRGSPQMGKRMFIAKTKQDLLALYLRFENKADPNFMLQEYIPGSESSVWVFNGYFDRNSNCLFKGTGKKIRQSPIHIGVTSLGICQRNDRVAHMTTRFMKNIGYTGIVDIDYVYDERDDKYKVLDINPRIGSTFRLFVEQNGLDVIQAEYLDLTGQAVPSSPIIEDRKWYVEDRDLISSIRYWHENQLTFRRWMKSFQGVQERAWFACDDLIPFLLMCGRFGKKLFSKTDEGTLNPYSLIP